MKQVGIVPIQIKSEYKDHFIEAITKHAARSLENEPGCLRFEVIQDTSDPNRIWLYEVYKDESAKQEHAKAPHSVEWSRSPSRAWRDDPPFPPVMGCKISFPNDSDI